MLFARKTRHGTAGRRRRSSSREALTTSKEKRNDEDELGLVDRTRQDKTRGPDPGWAAGVLDERSGELAQEPLTATQVLTAFLQFTATGTHCGRRYGVFRTCINEALLCSVIRCDAMRCEATTGTRTSAMNCALSLIIAGDGSGWRWPRVKTRGNREAANETCDSECLGDQDELGRLSGWLPVVVGCSASALVSASADGDNDKQPGRSQW